METQSSHRKRSRGVPRRALYLLAAAALLVGAGAADGPRIAVAHGTVEVGTGEPALWSAARAGESLEPGQAVRTGSDGRAEIRLRTGTVRLYENSLLRLPSGPASMGESERVRMDRGTSIFDVLRRDSRESFEVETPEAVIIVKGTRFAVALDGPASWIEVFRGTVGVRASEAPLGREMLVRAGFAAVGHAGDPFELVVRAADDPWDGWSQGRPAPQLWLDGQRQSAREVAVKQARAAALDEAVGEVTEHQLQRDPEPADPVAEALEVEGDEPLDSVLDSDDMLEQVQEEFAESVVEGSTGGSSFEIQVVKSGGPNYVLITASGINDTLTASDIDTIVDNSDPSLYSPALLSLLLSQGTDPIQFAEMLEDML